MSFTRVPRLKNAVSWLAAHPYVPFLAWAIWLSLEYFILGSHSFVYIHDNGDSLLPAKLGFAQAGEFFTYWDPQIVAGSDRIASAHTIDADGLLYFLAPGWLATAAIALAQRFVAGYFMFLLMRDVVRIPAGPAIIAGLAYSLFSQEAIYHQAGFLIWDGLGLPGLPLLLWAIWRLGAKPSPKSFAIAFALGVGLALTSSFVFALFVIPVILMWAVIYPSRSGRMLDLKLLAVMLAGWLLVELPFLWASALNAPMSHRADTSAYLRIPELLQVDIAVALGLMKDNIVALALATLGLLLTRGRDKKFVFIAGSVVAVLAVIPATALLRQLFIESPAVAGLQLDRIYLAAPFLIIAAGALGLHHILSRIDDLATRAKLVVRPLVLVLLATLLLADSAWNDKRKAMARLEKSNFAELYERPDIQRLSSLASAPFRVATVTAGTIHPSYMRAYGLESADGYAVIYPQAYQEFWEKVIGPLIAKDRVKHDYFIEWGNRVYLFPPTEGFSSGPERLADHYDPELISLANVRFLISAAPLADDNLVLISDRKGPAGQGQRLFIYQNKQAMPRFFLTKKARPFKDKVSLLTALEEASVPELLDTALVSREVADELGSPAGKGDGGRVKLIHYGADQISLTVDSPKGGVLVVTNNYSPYWKPQIDNRPVGIFPVDHTFQGVSVPAGKHRIELKYEPPYAVK